jgi:flagellin
VGKEDAMSGSLNSVNTNIGAMVALESLNMTTSQLNATQKQISTGYRVSDATDDGAAYAVAQSVRSDVNALTAANQQLGGVQGLLSTTTTALNDIQTIMSSMHDVLVDLSNGNIASGSNERSQYVQQYNTYLTQLKGYINDANYNGKSLIGDLGGNKISSVSVIRNEVGGTYGIATHGMSAVYTAITWAKSYITSTVTSTALGSIGNLLTAGGSFTKQYNSVGSFLNVYGSATNYVTNQISFNSDKIDALNTGLGALVDADMAQESAQLQALQIRQQLGTQALTLADQAPQTLLSLVKNA